MAPFFKGVWRRFVPAIGFNHVIMGIITMATVAWSITLSGCTSNASGLVNVYIISVSYNTSIATAEESRPPYMQALENLTQNAALEVRGAFFGICVRRPNPIPNLAFWDCDKPSVIVQRYNDDIDPLKLVDYVYAFVDKIEFYGLFIGSLILMAVAFVALSTLPGWHTQVDIDGLEHEVKPFPSRTTTSIIGWTLAWAIGFGFVSSLWVHVGVVAATESIKVNFRQLVETRLGVVVLTLSWVAVALTVLALTAIIVMILSIRLLERLTEDD